MRIVLLLMVLAGAAYVFARVSAARHAEGLAKQGRERWQKIIAQDPHHLVAHEALGDSWRASGRLMEARTSYLQALHLCGGKLRDEPIRYKIGQIELALHEQVSKPLDPDRELILCPQCGAVNPPYNRACETCTATLPYKTFREALRDKELLRATAEAAACVLVLMVCLWGFSAMPLDIQGVLIMSTVIVVGWRFLQAIGPRRL
jgi:tetratricopeptide (TPR) repeat protein